MAFRPHNEVETHLRRGIKYKKIKHHTNGKQC